MSQDRPTAGGRHRHEARPPRPARAPRPSRRRGLALPAALAAALCVPAAAAVVVLGLHDRADAQTQTARREAVAAARQVARDVLSYDYRTIDADIARAKADSTGLFAKQYAQTAAQLLAQAKQARAIVQASPSTPGVVSASHNEVVVLLFVDQASVKQLTGQKTPTTRIDQSRVRMTMSRVHGRWLVSQLNAL
ncbi:MAG: Mce-associated rane protein [Frankiaceae bacterium]|jgi:Mce-associated membrane protein|nr:Mce-associated rane protein [Frankiaceae bacterium]